MVTIAIISQSSDAAIRTIISTCPTVRCVPRLVAGIADRSATMRCRCVEYVALLLSRLPLTAEGERCALERHADALASAIRSSLSDAVGEVRAHSRACYWELQQHFPSRASKVCIARHNDLPIA